MGSRFLDVLDEFSHLGLMDCITKCLEISKLVTPESDHGNDFLCF